MLLSRAAVPLLWTLAVFAAADPLCDPEKQYLQNGECCEMCKPGTSMADRGTCRSPVCVPCDEDEYMDKYNKESLCKLQPYCHINLNFEFRGRTSKTEKYTCLCREGFHCSSASCIICAPHTECEPGFGAKTVGGQTQDTVCEKCPDGTFSDQKSWNGTCKKKCAFGYELKLGSSDTECALSNHWHIGLIVCCVISLFLAAALIWYFRCKGKTEHVLLNKMENGALNHVDNNRQMGEEEEEEKSPIIANPTDDCQETNCRSFPVESEYSPPPVRRLTDKGEILSQDEKTHVLSQPESQQMITTQPIYGIAEGLESI